MAQALKQRSPDFPGVVTCSPNDSLGAVFSLIKMRRVHRLVVVAGVNDPQPGRLVGVISLSDIMRHLIVGSFSLSPINYTLSGMMPNICRSLKHVESILRHDSVCSGDVELICE